MVGWWPLPLSVCFLDSLFLWLRSFIPMPSDTNRKVMTPKFASLTQASLPNSRPIFLNAQTRHLYFRCLCHLQATRYKVQLKLMLSLISPLFPLWMNCPTHPASWEGKLYIIQGSFFSISPQASWTPDFLSSTSITLFYHSFLLLSQFRFLAVVTWL